MQVMEPFRAKYSFHTETKNELCSDGYFHSVLTLSVSLARQKTHP